MRRIRSKNAERKEMIHKNRLKIGTVELENPYILAPMAGVTDLPFRLLCKEQGGQDFSGMEMVRREGQSSTRIKIHRTFFGSTRKNDRFLFSYSVLSRIRSVRLQSRLKNFRLRSSISIWDARCLRLSKMEKVLR